MGLRAALDRFNRAHPWSHNDAFTGYVLRHARAVRRDGGRTAVDVGCGTGNLLEHLARVLPEVIGIEPDHDSAAAAARHLEDSTTVRIERRRFGDEPAQRYDLVVLVASLHHMPLRSSLVEARGALRPGGRIVVVGVATETPRDTPLSLLSLALNPVVGLVRHPTPALDLPAQMRAPIAPAADTFEDIRAVAREVLPGVRMRRRLFWRYTAVWTAPR